VGEVKSPVNVRFDSTLSVKDLLKIAGGFNLASDLNNIDLFRLKFKNNSAPERERISISVDKDFNLLGESAEISLQPYDLLVVRKIPEFQLNERVEIKGEVNYPGTYILNSRQMYFTDLVSAAKGFTSYADISNVSLIRYQSNDGMIVFNAAEAIRNKHVYGFDPILQPGDFINVPFIINTVKIDVLGTKYILPKDQSQLVVNFQGFRKANWYINNYAGGFSPEADKSSIRITRENGTILRTKKFLGVINRYPSVSFGDKISLSYKVEKPKDEKNGKPFDWEKFMNKILAVGTSIALITLYTK
jgi:protein involved in polysaccharide export with SLBB domain